MQLFLQKMSSFVFPTWMAPVESDVIYQLIGNIEYREFSLMVSFSYQKTLTFQFWKQILPVVPFF